MKNITLTVDEAVLEKVRLVAAQRHTSVNALVRDYLARIADAEDRTERARRRLIELAAQSSAEAGEINWKREDLYER